MYIVQLEIPENNIIYNDEDFDYCEIDEDFY